MTGGSDACETCLRRSWLVARLAGHIERGASRAPGSRVAEILALDDENLVKALAPKESARIWEEARLGRAAEVAAAVEAADAWVVCPHSGLYPSGLGDLGDPPAAIFGRGDQRHLQTLEPGGAVTVVGSRRATSYGLDLARSLSAGLAGAGLTVVSGMALGIDAAAHAGALTEGVSCAVLGSGIDCIYPSRHLSLYRQHLESGLLLSELPPGTGAWRWTFPARNRLMAAIGSMTVVVEGRARSGSLITATVAQDLGRDLGAVPGAVTSAGSEGPNGLLSQGACLVRGPQDVLDSMLGSGAPALFSRGPKLGADLLRTLICFEATGGDREMLDPELLRNGIDPEPALARLELLGYLQCSSLGVWSRTTLAAPGA